MTAPSSPLPDPQLSGLTQRQRELARNALGLRDGQTRSFRNRYVIGSGSPDHAELAAMVRAGLAIGWRPKKAKLDWFEITRAGAELALNPGETLDPEDFPPGNDGGSAG